MNWDIRKWQIGGECVGPAPAHLDVTGLPIFGLVEKGAAGDVQQHYIVKNTGDEDLEWDVSFREYGMLAVSPTSGTLGPDDTVVVNVSIDAEDLNNFVGVYVNPLLFKNKASNWNYSRRWTIIRVIPPLPEPVLNPPEPVMGSAGAPIPSLVDLSWTYADVGQAQGFEIYYTQTPDDLGSWRKAADIVDPGRRAWRVSGLSPDTAYYFRVVAYAGEMTPGASEAASITTPDMGDIIWREDFGNIDNYNNYHIEGDAQIENGELILTESSSWQQGRIFLNEKVRLNSWIMEFDFKMSDGGGLGDGADGLTFAFVKDYNYPSYAGGYMDFRQAEGYAIELDVFKNSWDTPSSSHVGILKDNYSNHLSAVEIPDTRDANTHHVEVRCNNGHIEVSMDSNKYLDYVIPDFEIFEGYVGFTAATGRGYIRQSIDNVVFR